MSGVPFTFATAVSNIPLLELDVCFATQITIGSTQVGLGNNVTSLDGLGHVSFGGSNLGNYDVAAFTPFLTFGGGNTGMTTSATVGFITRIGDRVMFDLNIQLTARGASSGVAVVGGLPLPASNTANRLQAVTIFSGGVALSAGAWLVGLIGGTTISLYQTGATGNTGATQISDGNFLGNAQLVISGQYGV